MVLHRGQWITRKKAEFLYKRRLSYKEGKKKSCMTLSRKSIKESTLNRDNSLKSHMSSHGTKKGRQCCPDCGRAVPNAHALKKHSLVHRPREEWPFECPLCKKTFQVRGDVPKHLHTNFHKADNIPSVGTEEWNSLISKAERFPRGHEAVRRSSSIPSPVQHPLEPSPQQTSSLSESPAASEAIKSLADFLRTEDEEDENATTSMAGAFEAHEEQQLQHGVEVAHVQLEHPVVVAIDAEAAPPPGYVLPSGSVATLGMLGDVEGAAAAADASLVPPPPQQVAGYLLPPAASNLEQPTYPQDHQPQQWFYHPNQY